MEAAVFQFKNKKNKKKESYYEILDDNLSTLRKLKETKLKNTKLIVFHDEWLVGERGEKDNFDEIYTVPSKVTDKISEVCKELNIFIAFKILEKDEETKEIYDTSILINDKGKIALKNRRTHFVHKYSKGSEINIVQTEIGNIGMICCDEMLMPEIVRVMCLKGAQIIIWFHGFQKTLGVPKFIMYKKMKERFLNSRISINSDEICDAIYWSATANVEKVAYTRTLENYCCIIGAHSVGINYYRNHKTQVGGQSFIAVPYEKIKVLSTKREQILVKNINIEKLKKFQQYIFNERRPELFNSLVENIEFGVKNTITEIKNLKERGVN